MRKDSPLFMIPLLIIILWPGSALAHKISVFAWVEGKTVHAEGRLADGSPCGNCRVTVTDHDSGKLLLEGSSSGDGTFSFMPPSAEGLKIMFNAGGGHAGTYTLEPGRTEETPHTGGHAHTDAVHGDDEEGTLIATADMEALLDEKLGPIQVELRKLREDAEQPGATEVLGGIGYTIGLLGLATYIKYRKGN